MYAQVMKHDMRVNLIGGEEVGLPISHNSVICIDITDKPDVEVGMYYQPDTDIFSWEDPNPVIPQPTQLDVIQGEVSDTKGIAQSTETTTLMTSEDALIIMEMLVELQGLLRPQGNA